MGKQSKPVWKDDDRVSSLFIQHEERGRVVRRTSEAGLPQALAMYWTEDAKSEATEDQLFTGPDAVTQAKAWVERKLKISTRRVL